ncbi:hypothetical protein BB559_002328 [Furculomyces boomerangus]|uniref:Tetraspanin n=2 Tax=Harpellales TaxID=61421 RepID=A0A2T9YWB1_9FUNG|nr:hypothetical protein BB559_002328 [Furculomyces boomerangus]
MNDLSRSEFQNMGRCCGYLDPGDYSSTLTPGCSTIAKAEMVYGCIGPLREMVSGYLSKYYSILFAFILIDIYAFVVGLVLVATLKVHEKMLQNQTKILYGHLDNKEVLMTPLVNFPTPRQ